MCGIAGMVVQHPKANKKEILLQMLDALKHRGPDGSGFYQPNENVLLGHNRLSIIDLSPAASQPMHAYDESCSIIFNGEIYNYKELREELKNEYPFCTQSDTEVILALYKKYGKKMLPMLNGMFAIAIWDNNKKTLLLARDRFGVKPLYYSILEGNFYFASEIKALWKAGIPKEKNLKIWAKYLVSGSYGLPNETFWNNIYQLPAGHYCEMNTNADFSNTLNNSIICWYDFVENISKTPQLNENELGEAYLELLKDAVKLRFRSDVPVGFNISGGLDSSILLAMVNQEYPANKAIEAFTFYTGHPDYDELPWVEQLISISRNPLNKCLQKASNVAKLIEQVSSFQDEPFGGFPTLAYSLVFQKAKEKDIKVLLDGQGLDEAWAGYDYYQNQSGHTIQGVTLSPLRPEILLPEFITLAEKEIYPKPFDSGLKNLQYRDLFYTKIPRALRFNDRISMMYSTELREPFLDYRLVELAFAQNDNIKIKDNQSKWLLRQLSKKMLGNTIAMAPKRPLQTPQREWIKNELKEFMNDQIALFSTFDFVQKDKVLQIWNDYQNGNDDTSFYLWQWVNLNILQPA